MHEEAIEKLIRKTIDALGYPPANPNDVMELRREDIAEAARQLIESVERACAPKPKRKGKR